MMAGKVSTQMATGAGIFGVGAVLVGYMVLVEDELGAIPLLLVAVGVTWYFVAWWRERSRP